MMLVEVDEDEVIQSLRRAFIEKGAEEIYIDDKRLHWQLSAARYATDKGWLDERFVDMPEQQYSKLVYTLTDAGRAALEGAL